jgi:hypothetical protein
VGLAAKFQAAARDPELADLFRDLALLDARIVELLGKLKVGAPVSDETWAGILELTEHRRRIVLTIQKAKFAGAAAVSVAQFGALVAQWAELIQSEFRRLMSQTVDGQDERLQVAIRVTLGRIRDGLVRSCNLPEHGQGDEADSATRGQT